ncbi:membrane-spanning 4-domains subfamily A member 8-like [Sceloporus undulatus]|uniref:membrane-spanning 4-domains subfamily A member 8-like n=1 Tax=Sceloporus undulatus TaxID=8520 RepID=UPI001C4D0F43|nr:membrane-spanning 4-domains subfamily A member 8-like [Sceloporus undulatus]
MATDPTKLPHGTGVFIPSSGAGVIQIGQGFPSAPVIQPAGTIQYVQHGGQQFGSSSISLQQNLQVSPLEKLLKVETKTLGAIQIFNGLIHIGLGAISAVLLGFRYLGLAAIGGYPFWGGLFFIISGSLSVSATNHLRISLVKWSVGMNIVSAIMALTGISLYIAELIINGHYQPYLAKSAGLGISALLFLFSLLEFCIAVSSAHFGCQATCCNNEMNVNYVPYNVLGDGSNIVQGNPVPLYYPNQYPADNSPAQEQIQNRNHGQYHQQ